MRVLEKEFSELISKIVDEWKPIFAAYTCSFGRIEINNYGDEGNYFSEIEAYIWKENNVESVLNLILYLNGKQTMTYEELEAETNAQLRDIYTKISSK